MSDFVALLGAKGGPAIRQGSPMPTSSYLALAGQGVVVDAGLGVTRGLVDQGLALKAVGAVVITHLHSDHYLELGPLLHTAWTAGLKTPVSVWGPSGLASYWRHFLASMQDDIDTRTLDEGRPDLAKLVQLRVIRAGDVVPIGPLSLQVIDAIHPPLTEAFGLAFTGGGRKVVFSGDTAANPALVEFARGADLLVHEAMLEQGLPDLLARIGNGDGRLMAHWLRSHSFAHQAAELATQAGVKALALHHLIPSDDPAYGPETWERLVAPLFPGRLWIARDGLRVEL